MSTIEIELTKTPFKISGTNITLQAKGGDVCCAFGVNAPANLDTCYELPFLNYNGVHGPAIWVWKNTSTKVVLVYDAS